MKGYSAFPKVPASLEPHHQIVLCHIQVARWGLTPLQKCSRCILQPQTIFFFLSILYVETKVKDTKMSEKIENDKVIVGWNILLGDIKEALQRS